MMINPEVRNISEPVVTMLPITILLALTSMVVMSPLPQDEEMAPMPVSINAFQCKNISIKIFQYKFNNAVAESEGEPRGIFWNQDEEASEDNPGGRKGGNTKI